MFAYKILDETHKINFALHYGSLARKELEIMNKTLATSTGHVDFASDNDGFYSFCVLQVPDANVKYPTVSIGGAVYLN